MKWQRYQPAWKSEAIASASGLSTELSVVVKFLKVGRIRLQISKRPETSGL